MDGSDTAPQGREARLLIVNPNTNPVVTDLVARAARAAARPCTEFVVVSPTAGPFAIETPVERAAAVSRVLDLVDARRHEKFDAYVFACFDDIAVPETRMRVGVPVIDLCEAGILAAAALGGRFAIVTTVEAAVPAIEGFVARFGAAHRCTVRATGIGVSAAADLPAAAEAKLTDTIRRAVDEDGATAILLGSGALAGRADAFAARFAMPVIDGVAAAVARAETLAQVR